MLAQKLLSEEGERLADNNTGVVGVEVLEQEARVAADLLDLLIGRRDVEAAVVIARAGGRSQPGFG